MKTQILTAFCVFLAVPLLSSATKGGTVLMRVKPAPPVLPGPAFKQKVPLRHQEIGQGCDSACVQAAAGTVNRPTLRALNSLRLNALGQQSQNVIGQIVARAPDVAVAVQNRGMSLKKAQLVSSALAGAAIRSAGWNDPVAQGKIVSLAEALRKGEADPNSKQIQDMEKHCAYAAPTTLR